MSKIILPIAELKPALAGLGKIISKRASLPVLGMVKVDRTKDGWTTITGTDLDAFVTVRLEEPTPGEPASILVPYDDLAKTTKGCSTGEIITVEQSEKDAIVLHYPVGQQTAGIRIDSLPVDEFPPVPKVKSEPVSLNNDIRTSLQEAFECASTDETRYVINGACIDVSDKKCHHVVATDGRHLYSSNSFSLPLKESVIIPTHRFLGWKEFNADGEWQLRQPEKDSGYFQISSRRWRFIHRQVDGNYPNWRQVVPGDFKTTVTFNEETALVVRNLIPRIPRDSKITNNPIGLKIGRNGVCLVGRNSGEEKWTEFEVPGVKTDGNAVTINLNRDYLAKALKFGLTTLDVVDEMTPMKFSSGGRQIVVVPIRPDNGPAPAAPPVPKPSSQESSGAEEPVSQPQPPTERNTTMSQSNGSAHGTPNGAPRTNTPAAPEKSALETALAQVEIVKGDVRSALAAFNTLADALKQAQREQKTADKEVQSVRNTLEKLQSVRI